MICDEYLQASMRHAFADARELRHQTISVEQFLLALLDNPQAADALRACSVELESLRDHLSAIIRDTTKAAASNAFVEPQASLEFERVIQRAIILVQNTRGRIAMSTGVRRRAWQLATRVLSVFGMTIDRGIVGGADALVAVFGEKESAAVKELQRLGVTRFDVTSYLAHGIRKSEPTAPPAPVVTALGAVDVVLVNDDYTPMEFVVNVLRDHFELDPDSAKVVMLQIHREGRAVCGRFAADVAAGKVERVRAEARKEGHPLRCMVETGPSVAAAPVKDSTAQ